MKCSTELADGSILPLGPWLTRLAVTLALALWAGVAASSSTISSTVASAKDGPNTVLATIGDHAVTMGEVDRKVAVQLYDLRKQALDNIIDEYLVQQAARSAGVKPDEYVARQVRSSTSQVTAREAEQFYGEHKAQLDAQTGGHTFSQIEPRLVAALQRQRDQDAQKQLIQKLRAANQVSVLLQAPRVRVASAGHPSAGVSSAPITIV